MAMVTGIVRIREQDGSLGQPVVNGLVRAISMVRPSERVSATTNNDGSYNIDLSPGEFRFAAEHPNIGNTGVWTDVAVSDQRLTVDLQIPSVQRRLEDLTASFGGEIGVFARNLVTGDELSINGDNYMYLASVSKIAIAIGCVDLMTAATDVDSLIPLELGHHREERKRLKYRHLGTSYSVKNLLRWMISSSDTTATDVLSEYYGIDKINERVKALGIDDIGAISSMIQLDRLRWWSRDTNAAFLPKYALSLLNRHGMTNRLVELGLPRPAGSGGLEEYFFNRKDQATARAFGQLLAGIASRSLLDEAWKNDILLDTVMAAGGPGRFRGIDSGGGIIDSKGGAHAQVRNEAGIIREPSTNTPSAVVVVFTQRAEFTGQQADRAVNTAGDLALSALQVDPLLRSLPVASPGIRFDAPYPGSFFEAGEVPFVRWRTQNVVGPLVLSLEGPNNFSLPISNVVADDGIWHSFSIPRNLPPGSNYFFRLIGTDPTTNNPVAATSSAFSVGGVLHCLTPGSGETLAPGTKPVLTWTSHGLGGTLRIHLLRHGRVVRTISSNARNDGEWHSWTVDEDLRTGRGYQIQITSNEDDRIWDRSGEFSVGGQLEVLSPTNDAIVDLGSKPTINWQTTDVAGPLKIELIGRDRRAIRTIATRARNDGEWHSWEVQDIDDGTGYRIRIADTGGSGAVGYSDIFQIGTRYEVLSPSVERLPGTAWATIVRPHFFPFGQTALLAWRRVGAPAGRLKLELLRAGRTVATLSENAVDDGEWHSWTPDDRLPPGSNYQLRITSVERPSATGRSVYFSVGANIDANISQTALSAGNSPTIDWVTTNVDGRLTIDLLNPQGRVVNQISNRATDDGSWQSWSVPPNLAGYFRFRIRSNTAPGVFGYTQWFQVS